MTITYEDLLGNPNIYIPFQNSVEPTILDTNASYTVNQGTVTRNNGAFSVTFAEPTFTNDGPFGGNACQLPAGYSKGVSISLPGGSWNKNWSIHEKEYNSLNDFNVAIEFWIKVDAANEPTQDVVLLKNGDLLIVYDHTLNGIAVSNGLFYFTYSGTSGGALNLIPINPGEWTLVTICVKGYGRYGGFNSWYQNGASVAYVNGRFHSLNPTSLTFGPSYNHDSSTVLTTATFKETIYNESGTVNDVSVGPFGYNNATNGLKIAHFAYWVGPGITQRSHTRRYVYGLNFGTGLAKIYKDDVILSSNPSLRIAKDPYSWTRLTNMDNTVNITGGYHNPSNATEFNNKGGLEGGNAWYFNKTTAVQYEGQTNYDATLPIWMQDNLFGPGNFTIEWWYKDNHDFKTFPAVRPQFLVFTPNASNTVTAAMNIRQNTDATWNIYFRLNDSSSATQVNLNSLQRVEANSQWDKGWHHFAITCERDVVNNTLKFTHWLDGTRMSSNTFTGSMLNPSFNPSNNPTYSSVHFNFNGNPAGTQYPTGKVFDGPYMYNRVLQDGEIVSRWWNHNKIDTYARTWETYQQPVEGAVWPGNSTSVSHWKHQAEEPKYSSNGAWLPFDNNINYYDGNDWVDLPQ